jgi:MtN3 and saliva related transmembrane protein
MDMITAVGGMAAFCTTISYLPQLRKCWQTGHAGDLSLTMFMVLSAGVALWIAYGFLKSDFVIVFANAVSLFLLFGILSFKLRAHRADRI